MSKIGLHAVFLYLLAGTHHMRPKALGEDMLWVGAACLAIYSSMILLCALVTGPGFMPKRTNENGDYAVKVLA